MVQEKLIKIRCAVIGTSKFTSRLATGVMQCEDCELVAIVSLKKDLRPNNSYDLESYAKNNKIEYFEIVDINSIESQKILENLSIDMIISSWPKIIKENILKIPKIVIGTHPTRLPFNRGRHPLHWLLAMGFSRSALSFFVMDDGVDSGDIVLQIPYSISREDSIFTLNEKINDLAEYGIIQILNKKLYLKTKKQKGSINYWRARNLYDVIIDPRMNATAIINLVRSFTLPYPCAKIVLEGGILDVIEAKKIKYSDGNCSEHGKILAISHHHIAFKCYDGFVELRGREEDSFLQKAKGKQYIFPPSYYLCNTPPPYKS